LETQDPQSLAARAGQGQVFLGIGDEPAAGSPDQLEHVYRLADPALSELALEPLLGELLSRAKDILGVDTAAILLLDEDAGELVARAAKGLEEEVERGVRIPLGAGFAGRIAAGRRPIYIADVDHADVLNPILRMKGIRSLLGVPLLVEGAALGVLHVGSISPREFTNADAALLQLAAAQAAPAIDRARLFDALDREHRSAVALQRSLLPDRLPDLVGYHEVEATLEPGDTILLYTDGLVERRSEPLTNGLERLRALAAVPATADQLCQRVTQGLVAPEGGDDDIAVVALRIVPVEAAMSVRFAADPQVLAQMRRMLSRWLLAHGAQPSDIGAVTLACGEACANAIEHAYAPGLAYFELEAAHADRLVTLTVRDTGRWRAPRGVNRGRGPKMIEAAIDELTVTTSEAGTELVMRHRLRPR
jgi:anti-sigma regulatory factor (Ser/Thr protein kinase)/putative methionine-R-sulfoxide reductase with GAF domain